MGKKAVAHAKEVIKSILLIGFSIQIVLGIIWMCCNFVHDFNYGEPESAIYGGIWSVLGQCPQVIYVLQLAAGFGVVYLLTQELYPVCRWFAVWRSLALVTFPFAMQTALAVQPHAFIGSLFLLLLYFCIKKSGRIWQRVTGVVICAGLILGLSGALDRADGTRVWDYGWEASVASRMAWPTIMYDRESWAPELMEYTADVWWESRFYADNMVLLLEAIAENVGEDAAKDYYLQIAEAGWNSHASLIVRQVGWDVLGYAVIPLIFPLQLAGDAYDSYTAGNYAAMREHTPLLTNYYLEYGCWWFGCCLTLTVILSVLALIGFFVENKVGGKTHQEEKASRENAVSEKASRVAVMIFVSGILVAVLVMRGAGLMDYRWTVAVNQLWLTWGLLLVRKDGSRE